MHSTSPLSQSKYSVEDYQETANGTDDFFVWHNSDILNHRFTLDTSHHHSSFFIHEHYKAKVICRQYMNTYDFSFQSIIIVLSRL